jgi:hypothetical protein
MIDPSRLETILHETVIATFLCTAVLMLIFIAVQSGHLISVPPCYQDFALYNCMAHKTTRAARRFGASFSICCKAPA